MSLRSRKEGGRRPVAAAAAVVAGTLLVWLVITAIPAAAASTCAGGTSVAADDTLNVNIGPDDHVVLALNTTGAAPFAGALGEFNISVNNGAFVSCSATAVQGTVLWVDVTGSDAGAETFTMFHPQDWATSPNTSTTVDLGNGTDTLVVEYGALATPAVADPGTDDSECLASSAGGVLVGDQNCGGIADLRVDNAENIVLNGGNGDDSLDAGTATFSGNDPIVATPPAVFSQEDIPAGVAPFGANLTMNGGNGDDNLVSGNGNDNFQGGPGEDSVDYSGASGPVVVDLTAATGTGMGNDTLADVQDAIGSDFADTITGNSLDNILSGGAGNDTIDGSTGNDTLNGDAGNDTFVEGTAANGHDVINGGTGEDLADYSGRTNAVHVTLDGVADDGEGTCAPVPTSSCEGDNVGTDVEDVFTGSGNDTIIGSASDNLFQPGPGDDTVDGMDGFDYLDLSDAAGPAVFDTINGTATGDGNDTFANMEGFVGTAGDDTLIGDENTLTCGGLDFVGGAGVDTVDGTQGTGDECIDLADFGNGHEVENAFGGSGDDELDGNALGNTLMGNDGFDAINGYGGNDIIDGGLGNDLLDTDFGNTGADTLTFRDVTAGMGGEDVDNQLGFATGPDGQDTIGFFAIIHGTPNDDSIRAGQNAFSANNRLFGAGGDDDLVGSSSSDILNGGAGDDTMRAGGGDDTLWGKKGNDLLVGGKGFDVGKGGKGKDVCKGVEVAKSC